MGAAVAAALIIPLAMVPAANAADGDQLITWGNFSTPTVNGLLDVPGVTTDFVKATGDQGTYALAGTGTSYDPGTYYVGTNPRLLHELWVDQPSADPQLIINGFQNTDQKVLDFTVQGQTCNTAGSTITFAFAANMYNIVPNGVAVDGGAKISVTINGTSIGSEQVLTNDPTNIAEIVGSTTAAADGSLHVTIWNNGTVYSGNDFALDDITLTQVGDCEPPCQAVDNGVWFNYTGKYTGAAGTTPPLNDPKWHALTAQPGGEHAFALRGYDKPYNPGADKGKGDWFVWKNLGTTCP